MRIAKRAIRYSARDRTAELAPPPTWIEPQLCMLVTTVPSGDGWAHEVKFDGYRMHARIIGGEVALLTRTGLDWTAKYPNIPASLAGLKIRQAYFDSELCAVSADWATSFAGLQGHGQRPAQLVFFAFDLLHLNGEDVARFPSSNARSAWRRCCAGRRRRSTTAATWSATDRARTPRPRSTASKA